MFGTLTSRRRRRNRRGGLVVSPPAAPPGELRPVGKELPEARSEVIHLGGLSQPGERLISILAPQSSSGAHVNEGTALGMSAVYACVRLLSDMVAKLPVELYRVSRAGPKQVKNHAAIRLLAGMPSELHTSFELRKLMMTGKLLGGNGYAQVFRDRFGEPRLIQWRAPAEVDPRLVEKPDGERFVSYRLNGTDAALTRYDLIHLRGECRDGVLGIGPITLMRESIGTALAQTEAAGKLMRNGGKFPGFLKTSARMTAEQLNDARDEFNAKYAGAINAGSIPVLNGDWDFKATHGMSMVDAQFIESRRFELQEIARHFGIPPHLIGDASGSTSWGSGLEEQNKTLLNLVLDPHLVAFEQALNHTLLTGDELARGMYFRFDRDELEAVTKKDTAAYFQTMRNIGVYSVNDIRRKLDEPVIEGGDDYGQPLNSSAGGSTVPAQPTQEDET